MSSIFDPLYEQPHAPIPLAQNETVQLMRAVTQSLYSQLYWLRQWKEVATTVLHMTLANIHLLPQAEQDELRAKLRNLMNAKYEPGDFVDLMECASQFILVDTDQGNVVMDKTAAGNWYIWGRNHQTGERWHVNQDNEKCWHACNPKRFPSVYEALAYFHGHPELLQK